MLILKAYNDIIRPAPTEKQITCSNTYFSRVYLHLSKLLALELYICVYHIYINAFCEERLSMFLVSHHVTHLPRSPHHSLL